MRKGKGIIILLAIVLITGGITTFRSTIKTIGTGFWEIVKWIISLAVQFPSELGITDRFNTWVIYLIITVLAAGLGIGLTIKTKKSIFAVCGSVVGVFSLVLTLSAARQ